MNAGDLVGQVRQVVGTIPSLGRLLVRLARDPRVPRRHKMVVGAIGVYLAVPFDVLPDWIPGLGQIDDLVLVALALDLMLNHIPQEVLEDHWDHDPAALETIRGALASVTMLVPHRVKAWLTSGTER